MTGTIIDSKFRVLETLPKVAGRQRYLVSDLISGQMAVFFVLVVAAAEVAVGLAIIVSIFRTRQTASVDDLAEMSG